MTSSLKSTKYYLESLFSQNWSETPIHFAGEEFDGKSIDKWINIFYSPLLSRSGGLSESSYTIGNFYVICWANTDVDVMSMGDNAVSFMNTNIDKSYYKLKNFEIADHGWNESNKVFLVLTFSIETLPNC